MPLGVPVDPDENSTRPAWPLARNVSSKALLAGSGRVCSVQSRPSALNCNTWSQPEMARACDSSTTESRVKGTTTHFSAASANRVPNTSGE